MKTNKTALRSANRALQPPSGFVLIKALRFFLSLLVFPFVVIWSIKEERRWAPRIPLERVDEKRRPYID